VTIASALHPLLGLSDEGLMQRLQADDVRAFGELYNRHSAKGFGLARLICGDSQRAADALQDSFLAVWRSRAMYDPARGSPRAWLMTTVRHRSIDLMRRDRRDGLRESEAELEYLPAPGSVAEDAEEHDEADRVRAALLGLPLAQREAIALAYFVGLTHTEIATRLQLPAGTVKGRIRLGLQKVQTELNPSSSPQSAPA